jgi:hypothetical protein
MEKEFIDQIKRELDLIPINNFLKNLQLYLENLLLKIESTEMTDSEKSFFSETASEMDTDTETDTDSIKSCDITFA